MKNVYINAYNKKKLDSINGDYEAFEGLIENIVNKRETLELGQYA